MSNKNCPCKNCSKREIGCHAACVEYGIWRTELTQVNEHIKREKEKELNHDSFIRYAQDKLRRAHNHK